MFIDRRSKWIAVISIKIIVRLKHCTNMCSCSTHAIYYCIIKKVFSLSYGFNWMCHFYVELKHRFHVDVWHFLQFSPSLFSYSFILTELSFTKNKCNGNSRRKGRRETASAMKLNCDRRSISNVKVNMFCWIYDNISFFVCSFVRMCSRFLVFAYVKQARDTRRH